VVLFFIPPRVGGKGTGDTYTGKLLVSEILAADFLFFINF
jgi:hypothetical protein